MRMSIRNKLIILLLLITVIPFGSSLVVTFMYTKESLKDQAIQENKHLLYQGKVNMETYLRDLSFGMIALYNNSDFMNYLRKSEANDYISRGVVHNVINTLLYSDESVFQISMFLVNTGERLTASRRSTVVYTYDMDDIAFYEEQLMKSKSNLFIEPPNEAGRLTIHRAFKDIPSDDDLAFITMEVFMDKIDELSQYLYHEGQEELYLFTKEGDLIFRSTPVHPGEDSIVWMDDLLNREEFSGTMVWEDDSFDGVIVYDTLAESAGGWVLAKRIPSPTLYESAYGVAMINIFFGLIGLSLVIMATLFVSFKITSPIRVLVQNIKQIEAGNMKAQFGSLGNDEIGVLGERFKSMIAKINTLINREYKLELENKTNQLKVLHSQVNPHFLYNTLQSIGTTALKKQVPEVYTSLTELSHIMRYSMNMEEDVVSLEQELNYTKAYLLLQKQRFDDSFHYQVDVAGEVMSWRVPKMILQPIIENYFKHGFDTRDRVGALMIEGFEEEDKLTLKVSDNGAGISEERLTEICSYIYSNQKPEDDGSNIGLKNIYARLQLYYGGRAELMLENLAEGGFVVKIRLPKEIEGWQYESDDRR
ncbi:sensor histidine kinase [Halalkalibacter sp. APA_J-10(15)]|uniref:cache domain-containing sensor histidine kinase n=1 Tax=unclassified Halalkalibacter TaxID=2893063 RepID=UPI001FF60336|nr:sensor histidine kinase [Halalkalibacter sp. APA_J-10(15)]MCK0470294.1 histidine kinase [Halalkalibacter sp. APA_J-10(15)]